MIYVITHKVFEDKIVDNKYMKILHVGDNDNYKENYCRDDIGDNISKKNPNYCELTGLYWMWKNSPEKQNDITGLVHYRRYFCEWGDNLKYAYFNRMPRPLDIAKIQKVLKRYDAILPRPIHSMKTVKEVYKYFHVEEDLNLVEQAIDEISPEIKDAYDHVMNGHVYYYGNMIITKKKTLDEYSEWLFKILDFVEKNIDMSKHVDSYQRRVYGFISERLLQVWLDYKKTKVAHFSVFNTEVKTQTAMEKIIEKVRRHK